MVIIVELGLGIDEILPQLIKNSPMEYIMRSKTPNVYLFLSLLLLVVVVVFIYIYIHA